jgi:DNA-binding MarR family transcriptional regulator
MVINMSNSNSKKTDKLDKTRGFAKAFKLDIGREKEIVEEAWEVSSGRSMLMNPIRQKILKYLCKYPCTSLSVLSSDLNLAPATISWHLNQLIERKILSEVKNRGKRLFYPPNMINDEMVTVFSLLAKPKIHDIFMKIRESPGISQKELSDELGMGHQSVYTFTNKLENGEIISKLIDGKFTRYYPTKRINELENDQRKNLKEFRKWIIKVLKFDGVNPKLIKVTEQELYLQIQVGTGIVSLKLSVNPFKSILEDKTRFLTEL